MKFEYLAQDELDKIDGLKIDTGEKIKDPVTINIRIEMSLAKYKSAQKRYKEPIAQKILKFFK